MANENDILRDAIIGTEKEIFGEAFGKEDLTLDESNDRSLEAMGDGLEGQVEPETEEEPETETSEEGAETEDGETLETKPETRPETTPEPRGRVPAGRLREQTERLRAAEAERDALKQQFESEKAQRQREFDELKAQQQTLMLALQRQQPQPTKPIDPAKVETPPDLFENPQAFADYIKSTSQSQVQVLQKQMEDMRLNMSMENARVRHGSTFDSAFQAVQKLDPTNAENRSLVQRMMATPNPGDALVTWHRRNEALREVGDDPAAYKARIAEETRKALAQDPEFRKQLLEGMRDEALTGNQGRPRTVTKLPGSLNRTAGNNTRSPNDLEIYDGSDSATFNSAWS
jgi:hypothetical protein